MARFRAAQTVWTWLRQWNLGIGGDSSSAALYVRRLGDLDENRADIGRSPSRGAVDVRGGMDDSDPPLYRLICP